MVETISPRISVAAFVFAVRVGRQLDIVDPEAVAGVIVIEADVVEDEEFRFRADKDGVAEAARLDIGLGALGGRTGVAVIKLAGRRLDDVAADDHHRRRAERIDIDRIEIGLEDHVALVDRLPADDRAAVEHQSVVELILAEQGRDHGQVLPLALGIGEPQIDPFDLFVLDALDDVF
jgi:hypothetical protein